jgi:glycosyltransferase involved in cell wall biosynthesis
VKIALASDWFAPRRGGIETQLTELAARLGARGHDVHVLTTTRGARSAARGGYQVREIATPIVPGFDLAMAPSLVQTMRTELARGFDVVHAHASVVSPLAYASAVAARSLDLPVIVSCHSVLHLKRWLLTFVDALTGFSTGATIWSGVSELVSSQLRAALPRAHVVTLPNATDVCFWREPADRRAGGVTLVSTSRLHRKKRPIALLRAFAAARRRFDSPARLILLGEGPDGSRVARAMRDLELTSGTSAVELRGWVSRQELRSLYHGADAFVLASIRESFGIASLEARAAGLPVIAMRAAGSTEFLRDEVDALLCDNDMAMTNAMVRVVNDAALRSRLRVESPVVARYDWSAALERHEAAYREAIARAASAREAVAALA